MPDPGIGGYSCSTLEIDQIKPFFVQKSTGFLYFKGVLCAIKSILTNRNPHRLFKIDEILKEFPCTDHIYTWQR